MAGGVVKERAEQIMTDVSFGQEAGPRTGGGNQESRSRGSLKRVTVADIRWKHNLIENGDSDSDSDDTYDGRMEEERNNVAELIRSNRVEASRS